MGIIMIEVRNLYKSFGKVDVIKGLNLKIDEGEITALIGKNGEGKSTLIRLISGLYRPDSGEIIKPSETKMGILLGGDVNLYGFLTAEETLHYFGSLKGLSDKEIKERILYIDEVIHVGHFLKKYSSTLSRGMRQKLALAISIIDDPDVIFLDEPSTGLDIISSNDVVQFIKKLKCSGKTIVIATHSVFEISDVSDNIAVINGGIITTNQKTSEVFSHYSKKEKTDILMRILEDEKP